MVNKRKRKKEKMVKNQFRCRILGRNWDKSLKRDLTRPPRSKSGWIETRDVNIVYENLKSENSEDYGRFMDSG